jgi:signal transduction histidine kinase
MAIIQQDSMPFRPYARLMNIIGDQLITDKMVAVIEIIKNSYDADAKSVKVRFCNMPNIHYNALPLDEQAYIEIEDDGCGMSLDTIETVWLRPATPNKFDKKKKHQLKTPMGRIVQGEKGIGRFAVHKLGERIILYTKAEGQHEVKLEMNFVDFDPDTDAVNLFNQPTAYKLLDEVTNNWYVNEPAERVTAQSGTVIRIYNLREQWSKRDFNELYKNIQRMLPPIDENATSLGVTVVRDFDIELYKENELYVSEESTTFKDVIERAQFTMIGKIDADGVIDFTYKSTAPHRLLNRTINLMDSDALTKNNYSLYGLKWFNDNNRKPGCGPFGFTFYAFDLKRRDATVLNRDIEQFIKENFVFVLRDGVRVYPYGEKGIDWLNLDKLRATIKAGQFISYNDLTGFIYISQENNPELKDSSNRQGIVNTSGKFDDFTNLVTAATEIFNAEIKIDKAKAEIQRSASLSKSKNVLQKSFDDLKQSLIQIDDINALNVANKFIDVYKKHLAIIEARMETVEDLAGLGMAVEKSSHDSLRLLSLMRQNIRDFRIKVESSNYARNDLLSLFSELDESIGVVYDDMQMIQPLFKFQRKSIKDISLLDNIKKVVKYFRNDIVGKIEILMPPDSNDILVKTNTGLLLQVLINLVDNSIFWINKSGVQNRQLNFYIDPLERTLIVADNGNGIREDIAPLIFQEFFSMKSNGRGLGLYIVKELLLRINAEIFVIESARDKRLPGANFIIKFDKEDGK